MSPMNNRLLVPRKVPGLLDLVAGAAAAYSLRSLSNSYADPVVTVRRSSDDAEDDFTAAEVADGTLAAFCGAGDGFVKKWWDQSGNEHHLGNTVSAEQPSIVSSGSVVTSEGKPAMRFDGTDDSMTLLAGSASIPASQYLASLFAVQQQDGTPSPATGNATVFANSFSGTNNRMYAGIGTAYTTGRIGARFGSSTPVNTSEVGVVGGDQFLVSAVVNDTQATLRVNGATAYDAPHTAGGTGITGLTIIVGGEAAGGYLDGRQQELIVYLADLTEQREVVEGLIAWGYSV